MAFVPATPLAASTFAGRTLRGTCNVTGGNVVVARLGNGTGNVNSSLDKLGLEKTNERFSPRDNGRPAGFSSDYEELIQGLYRQIFGNAYIMESERAELAVLESQFRDLNLTVKEFCRALGKTNQYKKRFFEGRPLYGAIELNFKHFLGRTPDGLEQYRAKSAVYDSQGYDKFIDCFFDCGEYDEYFGEDCVPYLRGHLTSSNLSMAAFTHMFQMYRGASVSDKSNPRTMTNKITLNSAGIQASPLSVSSPGSDVSFVTPGKASMPRSSHGARRGNEKMFRIEVTGFAQSSTGNGRTRVTLRSRTGSFYPPINNSAGQYSDYRRSNQVFVVPLRDLNPTFVRIHNMGGKIASISTV